MCFGRTKKSTYRILNKNIYMYIYIYIYIYIYTYLYMLIFIMQIHRLGSESWPVNQSPIYPSRKNGKEALAENQRAGKDTYRKIMPSCLWRLFVSHALLQALHGLTSPGKKKEHTTTYFVITYPRGSATLLYVMKCLAKVHPLQTDILDMMVWIRKFHPNIVKFPATMGWY